MVQWTSSISAVFEHPIEHVWAYVSDVTNQDHWVAGMSDSSVVGGGSIGLGAKVLGTSNGSEQITAEVTVFEPPRQVSWQAPAAAIPYLTEITLTPQSGATRFTYTVTLTSANLVQFLFFGPLRPLSQIKANRMLREEVVHLRAALDAA